MSEPDDRREFLKQCGRFAAVTPPAITFLLSTTMNSSAIAKSGGVALKGNNGWGNGGDTTNPGSFHGNSTQEGSKSASVDR
jgi:hypothetical protein